MLKVRYKGQEYVTIATELRDTPLITAEDYIHCNLPGFAYITDDGNIQQNGKVIGKASEIEILETISDLEPTPEALEKVVTLQIQMLASMFGEFAAALGKEVEAN